MSYEITKLMNTLMKFRENRISFLFVSMHNNLMHIKNGGGSPKAELHQY